MKIVNQDNQKFSLIREIDKIKNLKKIFDDLRNITNSEFDFYSTISNQIMIYNILKISEFFK